MGWSTRELAELGGTTLRAVRHYHAVGLLPEPERRANGYKQYGVSHLVKVLRIKRLTDLGFSLGQIEAMGETDDHPEEALRTLDAELVETIDRLQRARVELGTIIRRAAPADLPVELGAAVTQTAVLSDADRSFMVVMSRVLGPQGLQAFADMLAQTERDETFDEFDALPPDADEAAREELAERMVPAVHAMYTDHSGLYAAAVADGPRDQRLTVDVVGEAMRELYNEAQRDVIRRTRDLAGPPPN
jgi:DNA-binding transcriptional MerR regulator